MFTKHTFNSSIRSLKRILNRQEQQLDDMQKLARATDADFHFSLHSMSVVITPVVRIIIIVIVVIRVVFLQGLTSHLECCLHYRLDIKMSLSSRHLLPVCRLQPSLLHLPQLNTCQTKTKYSLSEYRK